MNKTTSIFIVFNLIQTTISSSPHYCNYLLRGFPAFSLNLKYVIFTALGLKPKLMVHQVFCGLILHISLQLTPLSSYHICSSCSKLFLVPLRNCSLSLPGLSTSCSLPQNIFIIIVATHSFLNLTLLILYILGQHSFTQETCSPGLGQVYLL